MAAVMVATAETMIIVIPVQADTLLVQELAIVYPDYILTVDIAITNKNTKKQKLF